MNPRKKFYFKTRKSQGLFFNCSSFLKDFTNVAEVFDKKTQVFKENDEQLCISYRCYYSLELFQCAKGLF